MYNMGPSICSPVARKNDKNGTVFFYCRFVINLSPAAEIWKQNKQHLAHFFWSSYGQIKIENYIISKLRPTLSTLDQTVRTCRAWLVSWNKKKMKRRKNDPFIHVECEYVMPETRILRESAESSVQLLFSMCRSRLLNVFSGLWWKGLRSSASLARTKNRGTVLSILFSLLQFWIK